MFLIEVARMKSRMQTFPRRAPIVCMLALGVAFTIGWYASEPQPRRESAKRSAAPSVLSPTVASLGSGTVVEVSAPPSHPQPLSLPADPYQALRERGEASLHDSSPYLEQVGVAERD